VVGNAGITVPTKDPQALADGILLAVGMSPEVRRSLGAEARRRIEDQFGLSHTVYAYQELYRQVAENPNQSRAGRSAS
jgi:glycosyltransferase involved in cell wall biosynthesis